MINIGLCGYGTVGSGVANIINTNPYFKDKVSIKKILVHNIDKHKDIINLATTNYLDIINDSNIDTVIECIGGTTLAYNIIKESLLNKKNVVTANKAVLMNHLIELTNIAKENNVALYFEASVCGAINIIDTLESINETDEVKSIEGIINGSTNFVLTKAINGMPYKESLELASKLGFLESDPTDDLDGLDALRKLVILSSISYHTGIDSTKAYLSSIRNLSDDIINYAKDNNYKIKYIASSKLLDNNVSLTIEPCLLKCNDSLYNVDNELNSVSLKLKYAKELVFTGYGAGSNPTASAIMLDINKIIRGNKYYFKFNNYYNTLGKMDKSRYLIDINNIDNSLIENKINNLYITKEVEYKDIVNYLKTCNSYVRIK